MKDLIQERLKFYNPQSVEDEENALKEVTQEVALYALSEAGFYEQALFHGGTCLRVVHGLDRFSEDLDFSLRTPNPNFELSDYFEKVFQLMKLYGYEIEMMGGEKADQNVKSRFIKDDSIKRLLHFEYKQDLRKKIQIKVEVDVNPPKEVKEESNYLDFPVPSMVMTHDLTSLFSGKVHALLCRPYVKGRDWYDYLWYISKKIDLNRPMLESALNQLGPWKEKNQKLDKNWVHRELKNKIKAIDWGETKRDVERFLKPDKKKSLELWSDDFFLKMTDKYFNS